MKNSKIMPTAVLTAICLVVALVLALINSVTGPIIADAQNQAANAALLEVYPGGADFKQLDLSKYTLPESITAAYSEGSGGFVIQSTVTGYKSGLVIMCGINKDGKIVGADYIASNETLHAEDGLGDRFVNKGEDEMTPDIVAGSTAKLTTGAYYNAILDAFKAFTIFNGGEVDIRNPEQILQDNCNAALGTDGIKFNKWFATEALDGIDAVYEAENGSGRVFVVGESFIGVKADGTVAGNAFDSDKIVAANEIISGSTLTEVTSLPEGVNVKTVKKVYVTDSGNYVFELVAKGYQALFDYGNGAVINIKLSISADGKIIDCLTTSHEESKGYGDACATDEYYEQFKGTSSSDIVVSVKDPDAHADQISPDNTDIGAISSATFTTYGYQKAVKAAFEAFELITTSEGGNQ